MRRRPVVATVAVLLALAGPMSVQASQHVKPPVFVRQDVWFHQTPMKVANLEHTEAGSGAVPGWNTTKPTASAPLGAGGVYVANNLAAITAAGGLNEEHEQRYHFTAQGTFTGAIDNLAVELYAYMPANLTGVFTFDLGLALDLRIDGEKILYQDALATPLDMQTEKISDGLYKVRVAVTDLHKAMESYALDTSETKVHTVYLNAQNFYVGNEAVWVFDSAEAPAGAVFNLDKKLLVDYTVVDAYEDPEV